MGFWSANAPPPAPAPEDELTTSKWLDKAYDKSSEWARFADPKALGVLVILGLGVADLLKRARPLVNATDKHDGLASLLATYSFWVACALACVVVVCVSLALFPRTKNPRPSLLYFDSIAATYETGAAYAAAVRSKSHSELEDDLADQVWSVSVIASRKHWWVKWAYRSVLAFLAAWAASRVGLSFVG
jgi:hypothetical protein